MCEHELKNISMVIGPETELAIERFCLTTETTIQMCDPSHVGWSMSGAVAIATEIHDAANQYDVVAVSRFVDPAEATPTTPWAVAIFDRIAGRRIVLRNDADFQSAINGVEIAQAKPKPKPNSDSKPVYQNLFEVASQ